jgi:hypothetical protein
MGITSDGGAAVIRVCASSGRMLWVTIRCGSAAWDGDPHLPVMTAALILWGIFGPSSRASPLPSTAAVRPHHVGQSGPVIDDEGFSDDTFVGFKDREVEIDQRPQTLKDRAPGLPRSRGPRGTGVHAGLRPQQPSALPRRYVAVQ